MRLGTVNQARAPDVDSSPVRVRLQYTRARARWWRLTHRNGAEEEVVVVVVVVVAAAAGEGSKRQGMDDGREK